MLRILSSSFGKYFLLCQLLWIHAFPAIASDSCDISSHISLRFFQEATLFSGVVHSGLQSDLLSAGRALCAFSGLCQQLKPPSDTSHGLTFMFPEPLSSPSSTSRHCETPQFAFRCCQLQTSVEHITYSPPFANHDLHELSIRMFQLLPAIFIFLLWAYLLFRIRILTVLFSFRKYTSLLMFHLLF